LRALLKAAGTTALLVTHDQHEAFAMADRVGMMQDGRLEQWAAPYELYHQPASRAVAQFIGESVLLRVGADGDGRIDFGADFAAACCCESTFRLSAAQLAQRNPAGQIDLLVRPDDVTHDDASPVRAEVLAKAFRGAQFLYRLRLISGREVLALVPSHHNHAIGEWIGISLSLDHVMAFPA
jgi:iron(III) transport system ATP-binding protein